MEDWAVSLRELVPLAKRPVRVLSPCAGLKTHQLAARSLNIPYESGGDWETNIALRSYLIELAGALAANVHCGQANGDVTHVRLDDLPLDADGLIAGPPCPPFTVIGKQLGALDIRSSVFVAIMYFIVHLAVHGSLSFFILENVIGIKTKANRSEMSFLEWAMAELRANLPPGWVLTEQTMNSIDCLCPQSRRRVFIVGTGPSLQQTPFQRRVLRSAHAIHQPIDISKFLDHVSVNDFDSMSPRQQVNILTQVERYELKLAAGGDPTLFGFVDVGRDPDKSTDSEVAMGFVRTLRCKTAELWLFSPPDQRHIFGKVGRKVSSAEKCRFAGVSPELATRLSKVELERAVGNCIPVPLMANVLVPVYRAWTHSLRESL